MKNNTKKAFEVECPAKCPFRRSRIAEIAKPPKEEGEFGNFKIVSKWVCTQSPLDVIDCPSETEFPEDCRLTDV